MSRFVHIDFPQVHPGVARMERSYAVVSQAVRSFDAARGAATMLLAAMVAALLVVANEVVDTWTDGHVFAAWIAMWLVAFAVIGLTAHPALRAASRLRAAFVRFGEARRRRAEDDRLWELALSDARVMADLSRAMSAGAGEDLRRYY